MEALRDEPITVQALQDRFASLAVGPIGISSKSS
jgi:hypothetical protein